MRPTDSRGTCAERVVKGQRAVELIAACHEHHLRERKAKQRHRWLRRRAGGKKLVSPIFPAQGSLMIRPDRARGQMGAAAEQGAFGCKSDRRWGVLITTTLRNQSVRARGQLGIWLGKSTVK